MSHFRSLVRIMARLRSENGCPWDQKQTHQTLRPYLVEETYEVLEALERRDDEDLCEELGDLLLQIIFHAQIASEENRFDIEDISHAICKKLVRRHPHVFGDTKVSNADEVLINWEKIKQKEKKRKSQKSILDSVPQAMPALLQSYRIQEKVAQINFDWKEIKEVFAKIYEELDELGEALKEEDNSKIEEELGDLLFTIVNLSRHIQISPEDALRRSNKKFMERFRYMECSLKLKGKSWEQTTIKELNDLWNDSKKKETNIE